MTNNRLRPYHQTDMPSPRSVPVTVVVLTLNEEANISRCLLSAAWASQVVVVDSGSSDHTVEIARALGAEVIFQEWLGFSEQREFALRAPSIKNEWIYFVDADEWICPQLATEIAGQLRSPEHAAYIHRLRLVFQGKWIRHCGWYKGSWVVRLVDRRLTRYDGSQVGERARVDGPVGRLRYDIVDEDRKGFESWLHKHVRYARLEALRRQQLATSGRRSPVCDTSDTRPLIRAVMKDMVFPVIPTKPLALFIYMYILRLGFLDGRAGLRFCFYHAWYELSVGVFLTEVSTTARSET